MFETTHRESILLSDWKLYFSVLHSMWKVIVSCTLTQQLCSKRVRLSHYSGVFRLQAFSKKNRQVFSVFLELCNTILLCQTISGVSSEMIIQWIITNKCFVMWYIQP